MINVLIVDDHQLVGEGTKGMLESEKGFQVQYVANAYEALQLDTQFDIYIIDIHMPEMSGIELSKELLKKNIEAKIILYTGFSEQYNLSLFMQIGISGMINKTATKTELVTLIHTVLSGFTIVPLSIFKQDKESIHTQTYILSKRELTILNYISKGLSNKEIAKEIFISDRSVEYHLTKMYNKLNVKTRGEAVAEGMRLKLIHVKND